MRKEAEGSLPLPFSPFTPLPKPADRCDKYGK